VAKVKSDVEDEINALFELPLAEFTGARNALAARLKKEGRRDEAERVKLLAKPSVAAWAVNQLYWKHRPEFDELIATGKQFRPAQTKPAGKSGMRNSLDARREALVQLSDLATELLVDAGHSPAQDTIHRVITMLEALSAYALLADGPTPGRLTQDLEPPSFESLASLMSTGSASSPKPRKTAAADPRAAQKAAADEARRLKESREAKIKAAKAVLQQAKKALIDTRAKSESLKSVQKKIDVEAKAAEKIRREAEERLKKATFAARSVTQRAQSVAEETQEAFEAFEAAKRKLAEATKDLESLLRSPLK
jgi:hypothetical protein